MVIFFIVTPRFLLLEAVKTDRRLKLGSKLLYFVCTTGIHIYIYIWNVYIVATSGNNHLPVLIIKLAIADTLAVLPVLITSYIMLACY